MGQQSNFVEMLIRQLIALDNERIEGTEVSDRLLVSGNYWLAEALKCLVARQRPLAEKLAACGIRALNLRKPEGKMFPRNIPVLSGIDPDLEQLIDELSQIDEEEDIDTPLGRRLLARIRSWLSQSITVSGDAQTAEMLARAGRRAVQLRCGMGHEKPIKV